MKKVAVFIDVGNLYYCVCKGFNDRKLDYKKYLEYCKNFGEIHQATAYGSQINGAAKSFIACLRSIGYLIRFKDIEDKRWVNWNAGITIDIISLLDRVDSVIIGSADPDLQPVIEYIKSKGVTVILIAAGVNKDLRKSCNQFIEISEDMLEAEQKIEQSAE